MRPVDYSKLTHIKCSCCRVRKPVSEFHKFNDATAPLTGWRYYSRCKDCNKKQCKAYGASNKPKRNARLSRWRKENPLAAKLMDRRKALRQNYGISLDEAGALLMRAGYRCEICYGTSRLCIDHCHKTGRVRGILCANCNTFLGRVEKDSELIDGLQRYMRLRCSDVLTLLRETR
jgi:hypothetical protein